MMTDKAMLTEGQIKITPYAGNANRVTVEIDGVFFWCPKPFADMALAYLRVKEDAERYRWLRERMQVRNETSVSGITKPALSMRVGFSFTDTKSDPAKGWTDPKYFIESQQSVDAAIDAARKGAE
jgi:hypothetical protein